jgi:acetyl esterase/lipase
MAQCFARTDLAYGDHPRQRLDLFAPEDLEEDRPLVLCIHGGWWRNGWREDLLPLCLRLAAAGWPTATTGYRLLEQAGSGHGILADLEAALVRGLEENLLLGGSGRSAILIGAGAGAVPALTLSSRLYANHQLLVRGVVACASAPTLTPWEGCSEDIARQLQTYAGNDSGLLDPALQEADRFPPVLLIHGDADSEVPVTPARTFYRSLVEADDPAKLQVLAGIGHHILDMPHGRGFSDALDRITSWLDEL